MIILHVFSKTYIKYKTFKQCVLIGIKVKILLKKQVIIRPSKKGKIHWLKYLIKGFGIIKYG